MYVISMAEQGRYFIARITPVSNVAPSCADDVITRRRKVAVAAETGDRISNAYM